MAASSRSSWMDIVVRALALALVPGAFACTFNHDDLGPRNGGSGGSTSVGAEGGLDSGGADTSTGVASGTGASTAAGGSTASGGSIMIGGSTAAGGGSGRGGSGGTGGDTAAGGTTGTGGNLSGQAGGAMSMGGSTGKDGGVGMAGGAAGNSSGGAGGEAGATGSGGTMLASGGRSGADAGTSPDSPGSGGSDGQAGEAGGQSTPDAPPSTGGTGGGTGFNPCKASPCIILPLGDSITHGFNSSDDAGYRSALFKLVVAANQNVTFIGSLSNGPSTVSGKPFPKNHEGHDGITVAGITGYVPPAKAFTTTPHIVLVHIGTNDMTSNANPTTTANELDTLVTNLVAAAPNALIVVAKIVPLGYSNTNYTSYIAEIPNVVKAHADKNENVIMVDMSTLPTSDIRGSGNVHPTDQGYADMANIWYQAIKGYLPQ